MRHVDGTRSLQATGNVFKQNLFKKHSDFRMHFWLMRSHESFAANWPTFHQTDRSVLCTTTTLQHLRPKRFPTGETQMDSPTEKGLQNGRRVKKKHFMEDLGSNQILEVLNIRSLITNIEQPWDVLTGTYGFSVLFRTHPKLRSTDDTLMRLWGSYGLNCQVVPSTRCHLKRYPADSSTSNELMKVIILERTYCIWFPQSIW